MTDSTPSAVKTPAHLWVVGIVAVLWNALGAYDFTMTQVNGDAYLAAAKFTPEQIAFIKNFPLWAVIGWGAGTWGGLVGSVLLLLRNRRATAVFAISIAGVVVTNIYTYVVSDWRKVVQATPGGLIFSAVILVIAVLLWWYARAMSRRGVLR